MLPTNALLNLFENSPDHGTVEVGPPAPHVGFKDDQTARLRPFPYLLFNEWSTSVDGKAIGRIDISFIDIFSPLPYLVTLEQSHFAILLKLIEVQSRVQSKVEPIRGLFIRNDHIDLRLEESQGVRVVPDQAAHARAQKEYGVQVIRVNQYLQLLGDLQGALCKIFHQ